MVEFVLSPTPIGLVYCAVFQSDSEGGIAGYKGLFHFLGTSYSFRELNYSVCSAQHPKGQFP